MTATATEEKTETAGAVGRVARVIGPVVDVEFPADAMPDMYNALEVDLDPRRGDHARITLEVALHIGDGMVRAISHAADRRPGPRRAGAPTPAARSRVPVGDVTKGHVFNALGDCLNLEEGEKLEITERWGIHRKAPAFDQLESKTEMFETGIKVIDLLTPYVAGRQDRPVRRRRRRQDRADPGDDRPRRQGPRWCVGVRRRRRAHP